MYTGRVYSMQGLLNEDLLKSQTVNPPKGSDWGQMAHRPTIVIVKSPSSIAAILTTFSGQSELRFIFGGPQTNRSPKTKFIFNSEYP